MRSICRASARRDQLPGDRAQERVRDGGRPQRPQPAQLLGRAGRAAGRAAKRRRNSEWSSSTPSTKRICSSAFLARAPGRRPSPSWRCHARACSSPLAGGERRRDDAVAHDPRRVAAVPRREPKRVRPARPDLGGDHAGDSSPAPERLRALDRRPGAGTSADSRAARASPASRRTPARVGARPAALTANSTRSERVSVRLRQLAAPALAAGRAPSARATAPRWPARPGGSTRLGGPLEHVERLALAPASRRYRPYERSTPACSRTVPCARAARSPRGRPRRRPRVARGARLGDRPPREPALVGRRAASAAPPREPPPRSVPAAPRTSPAAGGSPRGRRRRRAARAAARPPSRCSSAAATSSPAAIIGVGARHVGAREVHRVLGRLEQRAPRAGSCRAPRAAAPARARAARATSAAAPACTGRRHVRRRANSSATTARARCELAEVGERVAEIGAVADPRRDVLGLGSRRAPRVRRSNSATASRGCPTPRSARPSVEYTSGRDAGVTSSEPIDRRQLLDRLRVVAARRRREPEQRSARASPRRRPRWPRRRRGSPSSAVASTLARRAAAGAPARRARSSRRSGRVELRARLEVLRRHAELLRRACAAPSPTACARPASIREM